MRCKPLLAWAVLGAVGAVCFACARSASAMTPDERRAYRDHLVATLPDVPAFDEWIKRTDELPPDFDALPRHNQLPDPLTFFDGHPVRSVDDWAKRRQEILDLYAQYAWGKIPPHAAIVSTDVTDTPGKSEEGAGGGSYVTRTVVIHCGPDGKGTLHMTLVIPDGPGPYPVMMGPGLIGGFGGNTAGTLLRRGYIAASYDGDDFHDDSKQMVTLYPDCRDTGALALRAWAASTALDYVLTLPQVNKNQVAEYGYSRDGKQALIATALDTRFAALVAGSPGVGGLLAFRNAGERNQAESIQSTTLMFPDWFNPRLRFFVGREDRLPVDGNLLLAAMAPRPVMLVCGYNDEVSNDWGDEQSFHSAAKVYDFLKPATSYSFGSSITKTPPGSDALALNRVPGFHGANDMEANIDFLDEQFGRSTAKWHNDWIFPWDYQAWERKHPRGIDQFTAMPTPLGSLTTKDAWEKHAADLRTTVNDFLGAEPLLMPIPPPPPGRGFGGRGRGRGGARGGGPATQPGPNPGQVAPDVPAWVIQRSLEGTQEFGWFVDEGNATASAPVTFGDGVHGTLYYPKDTQAGTKLPTVIWLHSYSYPLGYMWVYKRDLHPILALVKAGYAVLAYDQAGFGSRMKEAAPFYDRYPDWSLMGRMVEDVHTAIDALQKNERVEPDHIYAFGYSMGGNVALYAGATDPRLKGIVSICGFTPMRTDTAATGTGGLARYSIERPLLPKLGWYIGKESTLPYDDDDLLAMCAPRPVLVVSPKYDRDANPKDIHAAVDNAKKIYTLYNAADNLGLQEPDDYNRLPPPVQDAAIAWMKEHMQ
ncbi:MAG TPA: alpha/beta fold hydrolase [Phycisphaerae bacterium]|nr:alpha/beta fold hydrolase [Phycisphaerae bacterium]